MNNRSTSMTSSDLKVATLRSLDVIDVDLEPSTCCSWETCSKLVISFNSCALPSPPHPSRVRGSPHPFSKKGAGRAVFRKNQHWNGAGSDRAATVREAFPASAIGRLEERVGTGAFEACLQGQHCRSGVLPVVALLVSEGVASPQHQKLVRGGSPESRFKRDI